MNATIINRSRKTIAFLILFGAVILGARWVVADVLAAGNFVLEQRLTAYDAANNDQFGGTVALSRDGTRMAMGARNDNSSAGSVYVYVRTGSTWTFEQRLSVSSGFYFGSDIAMSSDGSRLIATNNSTAYIFSRSGTTWAQEQALIPSGGTGYTYVAMTPDATRVVLGIASANGYAGAIYVFSRSGSVWTEEQAIAGVGSDSLGTSVAISRDGDRIAAGAWYANGGTGGAFVYSRSDVTWTQEASVTASDAAAEDYFGTSISIDADGTRILVGMQSYGAAARTRGYAYVYARSGMTWSQEQILSASDGINGDRFATMLTLMPDGSGALIGSRNSAYVFSRAATVWTEGQKLASPVSNISFGIDVSIADGVDGMRYAVGAPGYSTNRGAAYVFAPERTLTVTVSGVEGSVSPSPSGTICAGDWCRTYTSGAVVTLTPTANRGFVFAGWSGDADCSDGVVTMNADVACTANFSSVSQYGLSLTFAGTGSGTVSNDLGSAGDVFDCTTDCTLSFYEGEDVALTPTPSEGSRFVGWSGDATCSDGMVTMNDAVSCTATFELIPTYVLALTFAGAGTGTVVAAPADISALESCTSNCSFMFYETTQVTLTPEGDEGFAFAGWSGDADCSDGVVTMSAAVACTASFVPAVPLSLTFEGDGSGTISNTLYDISINSDCTDVDCARILPLGAELTLVASASEGSVFAGWSGDADCSDGIVAMTGAVACSATFHTQFTSVLYVAKNGSVSDLFGYSVAFDSTGARAVVGAPGSDSSTGSAYIFNHSGDVWTLEQRITASERVEGDLFGQSVAMSSDGSRVVIGAHGVNSYQGAAYVYVRSGTTWTEEQQVVADDAASNNAFGSAVAMDASGSRVVVGSPYQSDSSGGAYIFSRAGTVWSQEQRIESEGESVGDVFGESVSINADASRIVVGASGVNNYQGAAYIFSRSGAVWSQERELRAFDGAPDDTFGKAVAMSGDGVRVLVGAPYDNYQGAAYVFSRSGTAWVSEQKISNVNGNSDDQFGASIGVNAAGDGAVIGSPGAWAFSVQSGSSVQSGAAYVYTQSGAQWTLAQKLAAADGVNSDTFGVSVDIIDDGSRVIVGAQNHTREGGFQGAAYLDDVGVSSTPLLFLRGNAFQSVNVGDDYTDEGVVATDENGVDISSSVDTEGSVNTSRPGTYEITYTSGVASLQRTVRVLPESGRLFSTAPSPRSIGTSTNGNVCAFDKGAGGELYLGGQFTSIGERAGDGQALLDPVTGQHDGEFPIANGWINDATPDGAGGWYIGGSFTVVGGHDVAHLAHIRPDRMIDTNFNLAVNGDVFAVFRVDDVLYVGGSFTQVGGETRNGIAAIALSTGTVTAFDPNLEYYASFWASWSSSSAHAFAASGDTLFVGGDFSHVNGRIAQRGFLAAFSRTTGQATSFTGSVDGPVRRLLLSGDTLYAAGNFTHASMTPGDYDAPGGEERWTVAAFNVTGNVLLPFDAQLDDGLVYDMALAEGQLFLGGSFESVQGQAHNYLVTVNPASGELTDYSPNLEATFPAYRFVIHDGNIYAFRAGFSNPNDVKAQAYRLSDGTEVESFNSNMVNAGPSEGSFNCAMYDATSHNIYVCGRFNLYNPVPRHGFVDYDTLHGQFGELDLDNTDLALTSVIRKGHILYVAGLFHEIMGVERNGIAAIDLRTNHLLPFNPNVGGIVNAMEIVGSTVYAVGNFTQVNGGVARAYAAAFDAATGEVRAFNPSLGNTGNSLLLNGRTVYIGGVDYLGRFDATTGATQDFSVSVENGASYAAVQALAIRGDTLYIGGYFASVNGVVRHHFAAVDAETGELQGLDLPTDDSVYALAVDGHTLYIGGAFRLLGGQSRSYIGSVNLRTGALMPYNPPLDLPACRIVPNRDSLDIGSGHPGIAT